MAAPFSLPQTVVSLVFLAYLAGTWASSRAGAEATRFGRRRVLLASIATMVIGVSITLSDNVYAVLTGLIVATVDSSERMRSPPAGPVGKRRSARRRRPRSTTSFTTVSSAIGWFGGVAFDAAGWTAVAVTIIALAAVAAVAAAVGLRAQPGAAVQS